MEAIIITRSGACYTYPNHRPLHFDFANFKTQLSQELACAETPLRVSLGHNTAFAYYRRSFYLAHVLPVHKVTTSPFVVTESGGFLGLNTRSPARPETFEPKKLPFYFPCHAMFILKVDGDGTDTSFTIFTYLFTGKKFVGTWLTAERYASPLPNVYTDCKMCLGTQPFDPFNWQGMIFSNTAFDDTCLVYPKDAFNNYWRWTAKKQEFVPASLILLKQTLPAMLPEEIAEVFERGFYNEHHKNDG